MHARYVCFASSRLPAAWAARPLSSSATYPRYSTYARCSGVAARRAHDAVRRCFSIEELCEVAVRVRAEESLLFACGCEGLPRTLARMRIGDIAQRRFARCLQAAIVRLRLLSDRFDHTQLLAQERFCYGVLAGEHRDLRLCRNRRVERVQRDLVDLARRRFDAGHGDGLGSVAGRERALKIRRRAVLRDSVIAERALLRVRKQVFGSARAGDRRFVARREDRRGDQHEREREQKTHTPVATGRAGRCLLLTTPRRLRYTSRVLGRMAELVDALDLGSSGATHQSSSLCSPTIVPQESRCAEVPHAEVAQW